jgi:hypothetical protein
MNESQEVYIKGLSLSDIVATMDVTTIPTYLQANPRWVLERKNDLREGYRDTISGQHVFVPMQRLSDFDMLAADAIYWIAKAEGQTIHYITWAITKKYIAG